MSHLPSDFEQCYRALEEQLPAGYFEPSLALRHRTLSQLRLALPEGRKWPRWSLAFSGGLALSLALFFVVSFSLRPLPLKVTFGPAESAVVVGHSLASSEATAAALSFSDGSRFAYQGAARVLALRTDGADVELEHGSASVEIQHKPHAIWHFMVGPYRVNVHGTRFTLEWSPDAKRCVVTLERGSIGIEGEGIIGERMLVPGQRVVLEPSVQPKAALPEPSSVIPEAKTSPLPKESRRSSQAALLNANTPGEGLVVSTEWKSLAQERSYKAALVSAETGGFSRLCSTLSVHELARLADVARYAGSPQRAMEALTSLRQRFPASEAAANAAYDLGRVNSEQTGDPVSAAHWFEQYLRERPQGALSREALGRRMEAEAAAGRSTLAKQLATQYLERYPQGPHADMARRLLQK